MRRASLLAGFSVGVDGKECAWSFQEANWSASCIWRDAGSPLFVSATSSPSGQISLDISERTICGHSNWRLRQPLARANVV